VTIEEDRAADYRKWAAEMNAHADTVGDDQIRHGFKEVANTYLTMAKHIEARLSGKSEFSGI
jgi:predicted esterase YcpF (UPF0227 family)